MCVRAYQADWDEVNENIARAGVGKKKATTTTTKKKKKRKEGDVDVGYNIDGGKEKENAADVLDAVRDARGLLEAVRAEEEML